MYTYKGRIERKVPRRASKNMPNLDHTKRETEDAERRFFSFFSPLCRVFPEYEWLEKKAEHYKSCASRMTSQLKRGIITSLHTKKSQVFSSFCSVCVPVSLFSQKGFDFLGGCCCQSTQTRRSSENETCFTSKLMGVSL